jgi:hypothetical protein
LSTFLTNDYLKFESGCPPQGRGYVIGQTRLNKRGSDDSRDLKGGNFKQQQMLLLFVKLIEA